MTTNEKIKAIINTSIDDFINIPEYIHDICHIILLDDTLSDKDKMVLFAESLIELEEFSAYPIICEEGRIAGYVEDLE